MRTSARIDATVASIGELGTKRLYFSVATPVDGAQAYAFADTLEDVEEDDEMNNASLPEPTEVDPDEDWYEVYEDAMFNWKAAFQSFINVVDRPETEKLAVYAQHPLMRTVSIDRSFYRPLSASQYAGFGFASLGTADGRLRISQVFPGSPADEAGLLELDAPADRGASVEQRLSALEIPGRAAPGKGRPGAVFE